MKIVEVQERTPDLISRLLAVWEGSVRATHLFLSDGEIKSIKEYVPIGIDGVGQGGEDASFRNSASDARIEGAAAKDYVSAFAAAPLEIVPCRSDRRNC